MTLGQQAGRRVDIAILLAALFFCSPLQANTPGRVMSLNLCADVLLLHLARPEQIASLTFLASSSPLSPVKKASSGFPINHGTAEEVVATNPDLVLVHRYSSTALTQALENLGFKLHRVDSPPTLDAAAKQIELLASALGAEDKGRITAERLRQLPDASSQQTRPIAAIYGPNGMTATPGSLLHDLVERAGLRNFAALNTLPANGRIPLETLLMQPPQALVLSGDSDEDVMTLAQQSLRHPALQSMARDISLAHIPSRYWSCGGPEVIETLHRLQALAKQAGENRHDH